MPEDNITRNAVGHFLPGSGGRPKGAKNKASRQVLEQIKAMGGDATIALHKAIREGQSWAVLYCLGKITPANGRAIQFEGMTIADVLEALRENDISIDEARAHMDLLLKCAELKNVEELQAKIIELETIVMSNGKKLYK